MAPVVAQLLKWGGMWQFLAVLGALGVLVLCAGCLYNAYALRQLEQEAAETPRDPKTGIALRAAPLDLGERGRPTVLLIHGFCAAPTDFGALPVALEEAGFRVVAPLLPGHGRYPQDLADVSAADMAQHVREVYEHLRAESDWVAVVGNSMGGALALRLTRDADSPPDALVLSVPFVRIVHRWHFILPARTWNALLSPFLPYVVNTEAMTPVNRKEGAEELFIYRVISTRFVRELVRLGDDIREHPPEKVPERTLLLRGSSDSIVSISAMEKMAERLGLPEGARIVLERSNHAVFVDYDRKEAIKRTRDYLLESRPEVAVEGE